MFDVGRIALRPTRKGGVALVRSRDWPIGKGGVAYGLPTQLELRACENAVNCRRFEATKALRLRATLMGMAATWIT